MAVLLAQPRRRPAPVAVGEAAFVPSFAQGVDGNKLAVGEDLYLAQGDLDLHRTRTHAIGHAVHVAAHWTMPSRLMPRSSATIALKGIAGKA